MLLFNKMLYNMTTHVRYITYGLERDVISLIKCFLALKQVYGKGQQTSNCWQFSYFLFFVFLKTEIDTLYNYSEFT